MSRFDVAIIGAGLGGLECAQILSKEGLNVCVIEKNRQSGGLFQSFSRKGHNIDSSIHYVGSMDENQILRHYFSYFGIMKSLKVQRLNEEGFDHIHLDGDHFSYAMGIDNFMESLIRRFPKESLPIQKYAALLKQVGDLSSTDVLRNGLFSQDGMDYFTSSAKGDIASLTSDRKLQDVLWGTSMLYAGDEDVTPFYLHAITNCSNILGAYRFVGGAHQVSDLLSREIRNNGGTLIEGKEVRRIVVRDGTLKGVVTDDGTMIEARYVISNASPLNTLRLIDANNLIKQAYYSRLGSNKNTYGLFCLYMIMKPSTFKYLKENHYIRKGSGNNLSGGIDYALVSMQVPVKDDDFAEVVTVVTPMEISELDKWVSTSSGQRGKDYSEFKERKAEELLDFVSECFPNLKENVEYKYTATPLTFRDITGVPDGSAYGIKKSCLEPYSTLISPKTKIPGLLLTGQNLNVHGVLGVTITSMLTCSEIVGAGYLAKKIADS